VRHRAKRFAEASTEKKKMLEIRFCKTQSLILSNDFACGRAGLLFQTARRQSAVATGKGL